MGSSDYPVRDDASQGSLSHGNAVTRGHSESGNVATDQLRALREGLVERIWQGLVVLAVIAAPLSASRSTATGWLPIYSFHLGMAALLVVAFLFRRRLSFTVKSALLLGIFWAIGLAGLFTFGILGGSYWWLVLSSLIVSTLYSVRAGIFTALAVTMVLVVAAAGFISGVLAVNVDPSTLATSRVTWAGLLLTTIATPFIVFQAIGAYQTTTLALLKEVQQQRDRIIQLASHDDLTGLPLLSLALDRLEMLLHTARRTRTRVAVLFIDLDRFKSVNDTFGHEAGDFVLKTIADRLKRAIRLSDTAARVGGDEFIVILGGLPDERIAADIAERIITAVSRPIDYNSQQVSVGASVGIGLFPDHATDALSLRRAADSAMYAAKRRGTNSFTFAGTVAIERNAP
jgi:diguanylate cyclase (GGDEF)-like protein